MWWLVVLLSGTAHTLAGELGEQWSARELRKLRREGWKLINGLQFREYVDIDHIAIGPGGVLVIETKWSAEPWHLADRSDFRLAEATERLRQSARDLRLVLRREVDVTPRPLLVLWGPGYREQPEAQWRFVHEGVEVLTQPAVETWRPDEGTVVLSAQQVEDAWEVLDQHLEARERHGVELVRAPTVVDRLTSLWFGAVGAGIGLYGAALAWDPLGGGVPYFLALLLAAAALVALRTANVLRLLATGALVGLELVGVPMALWSIVDLVV